MKSNWTTTKLNLKTLKKIALMKSILRITVKRKKVRARRRGEHYLIDDILNLDIYKVVRIIFWGGSKLGSIWLWPKTQSELPENEIYLRSYFTPLEKCKENKWKLNSIAEFLLKCREEPAMPCRAQGINSGRIPRSFHCSWRWLIWGWHLSRSPFAPEYTLNLQVITMGEVDDEGEEQEKHDFFHQLFVIFLHADKVEIHNVL